MRGGALASALALVPCGGCSVAANLSADELLTEVDAIVRIEGSRPDYVVAYADRAPTSSFFRRALYFGLWLAIEFFDELFDSDDEGEDGSGSASESAADGVPLQPPLLQPVDHVRELLRELPDEVGSDLRFAGLAASRFGWIAHYDVHPMSRIVALDGLCRLADAFELRLFQGDLRRFRFVPPDAAVVAACGKVRDG
ncbi:MAG: hypothetical protein FJ306_12605, partial [Planctomycetes bacterium]|nr:hypothetical protein [Planctomycetota bacterium]